VFCPKCGTELADDSQYCRKCGKGVSVSSPSGGAAAAVAPAPIATSTNAPSKAETRRWRGGWLITVAVLALLMWTLIQHSAGTKGATQILATTVHAPIELQNEVQNLRAASWKGIALNVPYSGMVNVDLQVVRGNPIDVLLTTADQLEAMKKEQWSQVRVYADFNAAKTTQYRRSARLEQGAYYLVIRDTSLGILSSSASDISVKVQLNP